MRELLDQGIEVGLGTDVSGGYSSSILTAAREAGMVSRTVAALTPEDSPAGYDAVSGHEKSEEVDREEVKNENESEAEPPTAAPADRKKLSVEECLYLATRGGAACLGLFDKIGAFEVGMQWDAQLVVLNQVDTPSSSSSIYKAEAEPSSTHQTQIENDADTVAENEASTNTEGSIKRNGEESDNGDKPDTGLVDLWGNETWSEKVAKWVFCGDDRNTKSVYVRGRLVHSRR